MNIVFFANGKFAINSLKALYESQHNISAVISNIDKPAGRNKQLQSTPVSIFAKKNNINLIQLESLKSKSFTYDLESLKPDLFIIISYKILPKEVYTIPKIGSINIHASYLPEYPGASPIQYSIINGEKYVGLTSFYLNDKIDKGDIIKRIKVPIDNKITYGEAHDLLANQSSSFLIDTINDIKNNIKPLKQEGQIKEYAKKIDSSKYKVSLNDSSKNIHNLFRGLTPPGPYILLNKKRVKLFKTFFSSNVYGLSIIGSYSIFDENLYIRCKEGSISAKFIQFEGKKLITANDLNNMNLDSTLIFE